MAEAEAPPPEVAEAAETTAEDEYVNEKVDPFDELFREGVVKPILNCIPPWVSPNNITSTNVVVRLALLYYSWKQNERPQSLTGLEIFGMSILLGVLMIITEAPPPPPLAPPT